MQNFFPMLNRRTFLTGELAAHGSGFFGLQGSAMQAAETTDTPLDSLYSASGGLAPVQGDMADRVAIRHLIDAWAHCADRRLRDRQANLFTEDGVVENYDGDPATHAPASVLRGRQELYKALAVLNTFLATTHFNGQSTIVVNGDRAFGESYCLAYELIEKAGKRSFELLAIRYLDEFVRRRGRWFFQKRRLIVDWKDEWTPARNERRTATDLVHPLDHVELAQLVNEVIWRIDNRQAARVHELFVEEGSLQIDSAPIVGREALREWGKALDTSAQSSVHIVSNQRFVLSGPDEANGSSILTTYSGHAESSSGSPSPAVGVDHDTYVRTADGWRLRARVWMPQFKR